MQHIRQLRCRIKIQLSNLAATFGAHAVRYERNIGHFAAILTCVKLL